MDEFYSGLMVDAFDNIVSEKTYQERAAEVVARIKKHSANATDLLELACGTGNFTAQLAKEGFTITATDIASDEIEKAKTKNINASFDVADMSELSETNAYDVVCCFWESLRYLPSYEVCEGTLRKIHAALREKGLFFVDFTHFPPHDIPFAIPDYTIDIGNGMRIIKRTSILTKEDHDTRWDEIRYELEGEDVTGQTINWNGKPYLLKPKLVRAPLLRIPKEKMQEMLARAGFDILEIKHDFAGCYESMLFVAQKK